MNSGFLNSLIKLLRLVKIRTRLIASVLLTAVIPMLLFANYSLSVYSNSIQTKLAQTYEHSTQIISANMSSVFHEYSSFMTNISLEDSIQEYLLAAPSEHNSYTNYKFSLDMTKYLMQVTSPVYPSTVTNISILERDGSFVFVRGPALISDEDRERIITSTDKVSPRDCLVSVNCSGTRYIAICRKIYDKNLTNTHIGYIMLLADGENINGALLSNIKVEEGVDLMLTDSLKTVISSTQHDLIGTRTENNDIPEEALFFRNTVTLTSQETVTEDGIIVVTFNPSYNAYSIAFVSHSIFQNEADRVRKTVCLSLIVLLVAILFSTFLVYLSILKPISRICYVFDQKRNSRTLRVNDLSNDELGILARTIDQMADENNKMLKQINLDDRKKRKLEMEALKYQINPHFLFNTLNTFNWIASINNVLPLKTGIDSLTDLLKKTLVEQKEFVPLADEIQCLRNYCTIQELRFAGRFDIEYDIDPDTTQFLVPRFILQPLVENSILHGAKDEDDFVTVLVSSELENGILRLAVSDDGKGFNVSDIMDNEGIHFNGIGLSNVSDRLRLHYGSTASIVIDSHPQSGTQCTITLPSETVHCEVDADV